MAVAKAEKVKNLPPKVMSCKCLHNFQDRTYGKNQRLHNFGAKKKFSGYACTVCGDKKPFG